MIQWYGFVSLRVLKLSVAPGPFCLAQAATELSWILSVAISGWQGLNLNINTWLPLFWSTWSQVLGPDSAKCAGVELAWSLDGQCKDYSYCIAWASVQKCLKRLDHCFFLELSKILKKEWQTLKVFNPHHPDWAKVSLCVTRIIVYCYIALNSKMIIFQEDSLKTVFSTECQQNMYYCELILTQSDLIKKYFQ